MSGILPPTPAVLRSYRLSTYHAGPVTARIGRVPSGMAGWGRGDALAMLSAANPGGRRMPDGWNRRAMARLEPFLRHVPHVAGEGRLGRWGEPLVLARLPARPAAILARRFRQNAIVVLRRDRAARLVLL
ncbi:DUF3293 domain-containing protein [Acetobacteraceae bacterium KSS8]|uniref:DUF3293 domain-containing protein n=1 Tax=Endosaccharibacter trunci TaxID=2812733 RepID=A0ABT1W3S4_9PROT|nr:DUF3293 domain-containing protein [Acetobacteraceae bacterium KSS8]